MLFNNKDITHSCRIKIFCGVFFLVSTILVGCQTFPVIKPLDPEFSKEKRDVTVNLSIVQDAIYIPVKETHAMLADGSLVGLILYAAEESVHNAVNKKKYNKADELLGPLQYQTQDIDFRKEFTNAFNQTISSSPWLVVNENELDNVLNLETKYYLNNDCNILTIQTIVDFRRAGEPLYYGILTYASNAIALEEDPARAIAKWTEDEAKTYRFALNQGVQEIMKMLRLDLLDERIPVKDAQKEQTQLTSHNLVGKTMQGKILKREGDRVIVRDKKGLLFSLPYKE